MEAWQDGRLAGGLYGVALGGAFFGESMFHRVTDASKVALVALVDRLRTRGYQLLDLQWVTPHLEQFGAIEIPRRTYLRCWSVTMTWIRVDVLRLRRPRLFRSPFLVAVPGVVPWQVRSRETENRNEDRTTNQDEERDEPRTVPSSMNGVRLAEREWRDLRVEALAACVTIW